MVEGFDLEGRRTFEGDHRGMEEGCHLVRMRNVGRILPTYIIVSDT